MRANKELSVAISGLKTGVHLFTFSVDDSFFQERDYSTIDSGQLSIEVQLDKKEAFMVAAISYAGQIALECDRCTDAMNLAVQGRADLLIKYSEEQGDRLDEAVLYINKNDSELDLSQFFYENIVVNVPLYKTCEDDVSGSKKCIEQVVSYLEIAEEKENIEETDPRWEKLKQLKGENNGTSEK